MIVLKKDGNAIACNSGVLCAPFIPVYMETPGMSVQTSDEYNGIVFAWNEVNGSHVEIPISVGGCTLFSYYHCCQTINARYGGYVADSFIDWFNHFGGEDYFKGINYFKLFPTLETLTGIRCNNTKADVIITDANAAAAKQAIYDEICSGMPVTLSITLHGDNGETGGHSIMAKGIDRYGKLIICDSLQAVEKKVSFEDLLEANNHDGYSIVRVAGT